MNGRSRFIGRGGVFIWNLCDFHRPISLLLKLSGQLRLGLVRLAIALLLADHAVVLCARGFLFFGLLPLGSLWRRGELGLRSQLRLEHRDVAVDNDRGLAPSGADAPGVAFCTLLLLRGVVLSGWLRAFPLARGKVLKGPGALCPTGKTITIL